MEFFLLQQIVVFLIDVTAISLGLVVFFSRREQKMGKIFAWMVIAMLCWVNFAYLARLFKESEFLSVVFLKSAWFATPIFFVLLYFLVIYLLNKEKEYRVFSRIIWGIGAISALLTGTTDFIVEGIMVINGTLTIIYGKGMLPFLLGIFFVICATLYPLLKGYFKARPEERKKLVYFLSGIAVFYVANMIFNIGLPIFLGIAKFYYFGDYSTVILLGFTAYAIVAKELFGIRVILTQTLIAAISVLFLWQAVTAESLIDLILKTSLFLLFLVFGFFLIKNVIQEIRRRTELQHLYEEVDKLSKAKSEFISIASHQLRTPLTAIKGYISLLIEGTYGKLSSALAKPLENVYESNEKLVRLVDDLLDLSRLEAGKIKFEPAPEQLEKIVSGIIEEMKINADKKGLSIKLVKPKEPLPEVMVDEPKLRQVILNIIDNAIKYTNHGGITVELKIEELPEGHKGKLKIIISDTGAGITQEEIKNLFQMFSRESAGAKLHAGGAGVGLHVAKKFIEMHQGRIWVESPGRGKGSTFYIELPIK